MASSAFDDYKYDGAQIPMEEIRVLHFSVGTQIPAIRASTYKIFTPGLVENQERILSITPTTEKYGPTERHMVDVYKSKDVDGNEGGDRDERPILVFFYGGGFVLGDRKLEGVAEGLVYANLGTFFAARGVTVLVPDYRRVDGKKGGEGAVFPSGGEDVSFLLKWLETSSLLGNRKRDVILFGNSAGGAHVATFLFDEKFLEQRRQYSTSGKGVLQGAREYVTGGGKGIYLKSAILLGIPAHFEKAAKDRKEALRSYYGSEDKAIENCPLGLLKTLSSSKVSLQEAAIPKILALTGEYDPPDEILEPMEDFVSLWKETYPSHAMEFIILDGHNHISPIAALMSGDEKGELWGEDLVTHILGHHGHTHPKAHTIPRGPKKDNEAQVSEDTSTREAEKVDKETGAADEKNKKVNPAEDHSTQEVAEITEGVRQFKWGSEKKKSAKKLDPSEDTSTKEAAEVDEKHGSVKKDVDPREDSTTSGRETTNTNTTDPSEDFSTEKAGSAKKDGVADPTEDVSTREAAKEDWKRAQPTENGTRREIS